MKLKRFEPFKHNKPLRFGLAALIALLLVLAIYGDRTGWWRKTMGETPAEAVIECPELKKGCSVHIKGKPYSIKSDIPLEAGKPFLLDVVGEAVSVKAFWRMTNMDMGPNNYKLEPAGNHHWQAKVTLPPCPHGGTKWQLHLEVNARAADINTQLHGAAPTMPHPMKK